MKVREIYKQLTPEMRGQFWTITTNCFLVLVTFWMGITIQYMVYNMGSERQDQVMRHQIVDKIYPLYQNAYNSSATLIGKMAMCLPKNDAPMEINKVIVENKDEIIEAAKQSIPVMEKASYYVNEKTHGELRKNIAQIKTMLKLIQWTSHGENLNDKQLKDSIALFMAGEEIFFAEKSEEMKSLILDMVRNGRQHPKGLEAIAVQRMTMPIVENYKLLRSEMFYYPHADILSKKILTHAIIILIASSGIALLIWRILLQAAFGKNKQTTSNL